MEQEEKIKEKTNWLFEEIKEEYAGMAKRNRVWFVILCVILGIFLIETILHLTGVFEPYGIKGWLSSFLFYGALFICGLYSKTSINKMVKASTPQELLVAYDKNRKWGLWTCIAVIVLFVIANILKDDLSKNTFFFCLLFAAFLTAVFYSYSKRNRINQLRELVQQS